MCVYVDVCRAHRERLLPPGYILTGLLVFRLAGAPLRALQVGEEKEGSRAEGEDGKWSSLKLWLNNSEGNQGLAANLVHFERLD